MARVEVSTIVRLHPPELLDAIDAVAKANGLSRNEWMVRVLRNAAETDARILKI